MSTTKIKDKIIFSLWGKAGGVCEICGEPLATDALTKRAKHRGYVAHIYGEKANAARYDNVKSKLYCEDINYLMLLCNSCHKRIDIDEPENYPVERLVQIKKYHEQKVENIVSCFKKAESQIITCKVKIGDVSIPEFNNEMLLEAVILNDKCPSSANPVSLVNFDFLDDSQELFWQTIKAGIIQEYNKKKELFSNVKHWSLFAIAPQPILILIGRLMTNLSNVDIYQLHRDEQSWIWPQNNYDTCQFKIKKPENINKKNVAINLSLSGSISNDRIIEIIGEDVAIWEISISSPNLRFVKNNKIQVEFQKVFEQVLEEINKVHNNIDKINIFPAVPQSLAICIGRAKMPKVDLPFVIYDQNNKKGKFIETIVID